MKRVVITGAGVVTAAGATLGDFWGAVLRGETRIGALQSFSCDELGPLRGAEISYALEEWPTALGTRRGRATELACAAARRAIIDAGLGPTEPRPSGDASLPHVGVVVGTTLGEERAVSDHLAGVLGGGAADAELFERLGNHHLAGTIALEHGLGGPTFVATTACSSGNMALALGYDQIVSGGASAMVAGGTDTFTRSIYYGFTRMGALSKSMCRPFDQTRDGVSFGEGSGFLVLEELEAAERRGARIYAEFLGYGISNDAYHITAPEPSGDGFVRAIRQALSTSQLRAEDVDYVSAHGTGTAYNDASEVAAMRAVFGERAPQVPISSIKGTIGHTNGASSAIEAVACTLALVNQTAPPTTNLLEPDPAFGLDFIPGQGRPMKLDVCLNLGAGFGGFNVCTALRRFS